MIRLLLLVIPLALFAVTVGLAGLLLRPLIRLLKSGADWFARLATALLGGAAAAAAGGFLVALIAEAEQAADPRAAGSLAGAILFPLATAALFWWQGRARVRAAAAADRHMAMARRLEPPGDAALAASWDIALALARPGDRRLAAARRACARLLHAADATPLDVEAMDCAIIIRRHIPDLIAHTAALCENAGREEAQGLTEDMIASIEKIAADADRLNERERNRLRHGLKVLRAHIDSRTAKGPI